MATHFLDIEDEDHFDFELVGISSRERDYRLAWALNRKLSWNLERMPEIVVSQRTGESEHAHFRFVHAEDQSIISLIGNRTPEGYLLPEWQQFEFLLKVEYLPEGLTDRFMKELRTAPFVLAAYMLEPEKLKSRNNLIIH